MGRLVLPHALLPAVKGLRLKPSAGSTMLSPGYTAPQEAEAESAEETSGEEHSEFCLIDTFRRAVFNPKVNVSFPPFLKSANKRWSVLSITTCACKSILSLSPSIFPPRNYCVFTASTEVNAIYTKKEEGEEAWRIKGTLLKNPGDVLIASPLHHGWKIQSCEM